MKAEYSNSNNELEDDLLIDTSKMNQGQREALETAEAARDSQSANQGFASKLFLGQFDPTSLVPFPDQSAEDKQIGDEYIASLSDYLEEHLDPEQVDETRTIPQAAIDELVRRGVFAMKIPEDYEGMGFSQINYNRVMMMLASHCGSTAVLASAHQSIGVPQPLKLFGTEEQKRKYLPRFRKGAISAFALTEPNVGSDPAQMSTVAEPNPDGATYTLNGEKLWCTNGTIADIIVVMARTPSKMVRGRERKQITAFILEMDRPGVEIAHRCDFMGIRGIQNGLIRFKDVVLSKDDILWGEGKGLKLALTTLNTGRLTLPAACTGMAKQCLSIARRWGNHREQWGAPIGKHEAGRSKIASIAAHTLAMEAVTYLTSHWADQGDVDIRIEAAMAKLFCSEIAWKVVDDTMQLRGGRGYEKATSLKQRGEPGFPVERMMRECRINRIIEGTTEVMHLFLAREALDPHLKLASPLLMPDSKAGEKAKAALSAATFYAKWYPLQWMHLSSLKSYPELDELESQFRFIAKTSHKLARTMFHLMAKHQDRLEKRQNLLARLMEIGTELFAMAATCSYAIHLANKAPEETNPISLAQLFCAHSRIRIAAQFRGIKSNTDRSSHHVAGDVLSGSYGWLEKGIIESEPNAYQREAVAPSSEK